ncbi:MAG: DUF1015 domain-containing protein [Phycisphaerales bacterium]|nr:DUF1015 domain-containing protein [Phycisphaerales bacterium]MCB9862802.1 DUF1015 domain-containing protein [Phycisphaerales bacterium]
MARIEPFTAIRFNSADVSHLIAPPYDILDQADKDALRAKDDHNIVGIDLPHVPPKTAGPEEVYLKAAGDLTCWLDIRALVRDSRPGLYVYHQTYKLGSKTLTRKKFFARLRLEELGQGQIFAHEQTFGGPKEDRLKLTTATRCNVSPIFGLYPDETNEISKLIDEAIEGEPDQQGMLDGVENKLWVIDDLPTIKSIQVRMADKPIFIADGHHRYGTALMYREQHIAEYGAVGDDDPVNFVLAVLGGMEDPGATIQPYFRAMADLPGVTSNAMKDALAGEFDWKPAAMPKDDASLAKTLAKAGPQAIGLYVAKDDAFAIVTPKDADPLASLEKKHNPAWRTLSYTILHKLIIDRLVSPKLNDGKPVTMHYQKTMGESVADAKASSGIACLMQATTMQQLRDICTAGELMPQKSTYFFPKLATGMVINPLY